MTPLYRQGSREDPDDWTEWVGAWDPGHKMLVVVPRRGTENVRVGPVELSRFSPQYHHLQVSHLKRDGSETQPRVQQNAQHTGTVSVPVLTIRLNSRI